MKKIKINGQGHNSLVSIGEQTFPKTSCIKCQNDRSGFTSQPSANTSLFHLMHISDKYLQMCC